MFHCCEHFSPVISPQQPAEEDLARGGAQRASSTPGPPLLHPPGPRSTSSTPNPSGEPSRPRTVPSPVAAVAVVYHAAQRRPSAQRVHQGPAGVPHGRPRRHYPLTPPEGRDMAAPPLPPRPPTLPHSLPQETAQTISFSFNTSYCFFFLIVFRKWKGGRPSQSNNTFGAVTRIRVTLARDPSSGEAPPASDGPRVDDTPMSPVP